jgi:DNA-binding transcriptional LysR family regulator
MNGRFALKLFQRIFDTHHPMKALSDLHLFVRAAQAASLSEAARAMDMTPAAASAAIKRLEVELGAPLFVRTTRHLRLSTQGELFLNDCRAGLEILTQARDRLANGRDQVSGVVNFAMPSDLGRNVVLPWLHEFQARHPQVHIRLQVSDRVIDIVRHTVDLALRYGDPPDSSLVSLSVAPLNRRSLCAAPAYIARHGAPHTPHELVMHNCLCFLLSDRTHDHWTFMRGAEVAEVDVRGRFQCDDGDAVRRLALRGEGIIYKSTLDVAADLHSGALVRLCPDWQGESAALNLVCAGRRHLRPAMRLLHTFLVEQFQALDNGA